MKSLVCKSVVGYNVKKRLGRLTITNIFLLLYYYRDNRHHYYYFNFFFIVCCGSIIVKFRSYLVRYLVSLLIRLFNFQY